MHNTTPTQAHASPDVMTLVNELITACTDNTMEAEMLRKQCTRKLYAILGEPMPKDFPSEFETAEASFFTKQHGYTNSLQALTRDEMLQLNTKPTTWGIKYPSRTKEQIIERYTRDGWHCTVQAYNVLCYKYAPHPRFPHVWVCFISTRDTARYEYVLERPNDSNA